MNDSLGHIMAPEIIEADPVSYSFATPGWYIVAGLLVLTAVIIVIVILLRYRRNAYRRRGLVQLEEILARGGDRSVYMLNQLLKTMALDKFGTGTVAPLYGKEWLDFLAKTAPGMPLPEKGWTERWADALYAERAMKDVELKAMGDFAAHWIRKHDAGKL